jgi:hypothetical protein
MKFRDQDINEVKILENADFKLLEADIQLIGESNIIVDLQYSTRVDWVQYSYNGNPMTDAKGAPIFYPTTIYSAILLLRKL